MSVNRQPMKINWTIQGDCDLEKFLDSLTILSLFKRKGKL